MWKCSSGSLRLFRNAGQYRTMAETPAKLPTASLAPIPTGLVPIHRGTGPDQFRPDRAAPIFDDGPRVHPTNRDQRVANRVQLGVHEPTIGRVKPGVSVPQPDGVVARDGPRKSDEGRPIGRPSGRGRLRGLRSGGLDLERSDIAGLQDEPTRVRQGEDARHRILRGRLRTRNAGPVERVVREPIPLEGSPTANPDAPTVCGKDDVIPGPETGGLARRQIDAVKIAHEHRA